MNGVRLCLALFVAWLIAGCGGSGGGVGDVFVQPTISVYWAERSRAITGPSSAQSIQITLTQTGRPDVVVTANRPDGTDAVLATVKGANQVKVGDATLAVAFFSDPDAVGDKVATAADSVKIDANGFIETSITTGSNITRTVLTAGQSIRVGDTIDLGFSAYDAQGRLVAVSPGSAFFAAATGSEFITFADGRATGASRGKPTVTVTIDDKVSTPELVSVTPAPSVTFIEGGHLGVVSSFANDATPDGKYVVGSARTDSRIFAYRWSRAGGIEDLGLLPGTVAGEASAISADGSTIVGTCADAQDQEFPFVWQQGASIQLLPLEPGLEKGNANDVTDDGSVVVGTARTTAGQVSVAVSWSGGADSEVLYEGEANCITPSGSYVVGVASLVNVGDVVIRYSGEATSRCSETSSRIRCLEVTASMRAAERLGGNFRLGRSTAVPAIGQPVQACKSFQAASTHPFLALLAMARL